MRVERFRPNTDQIQEVFLSYEQENELRKAGAALFSETQEDKLRSNEPEIFKRMAQEAESLNRFDGLRDYLGEFATHEAAKVVVIHGPEPDEGSLPPTPDKYRAAGEAPRLTEAAMWRGMLIGLIHNWRPYGFKAQQNGAILNDVIFDRQHSQTKGISANATEALDYHIEDAYLDIDEAHKLNPDILSLNFLRNPGRAPTVVSVANLAEAGRLQPLLFEPFFHNLANAGQTGEHAQVSPVPILYGDPENPRMRFNAANVDRSRYSAEEREAIAHLVGTIVGGSVEIGAAPGDILLIDNTRAPHGRAALNDLQRPKWNGYDRWQQRLAITEDYARVAPYETEPGSMVVDGDAMLGELAEAA